jgi:hypothetical protein
MLKEFKWLNDEALYWCARWGGVAYWHVSLHESYTGAFKEQRTDEWEEELWEHAANGRRILYRLMRMVERMADRPHEAHKLKVEMRILMDMMQMVTMGITVLNMRCSILPDDLWRAHRLEASDQEFGVDMVAEDCSGDSDFSRSDG